ncbi:electron transport complex subunit RsxG [Paraferrimonas haliotis]|uniref:Ion-translocating oxidoreductase complex subunit G n=1 Tax=Paraferrimonas haliotis TaxID=2013866 RepID=A0AA37X013_9GAMM|nr:electron transport complex subunit RsxG [Paraferrimonas haliotis]GLS84426.1 electron transport complex subunit G [Paraferrimonas haliotis]
MKTSMTKNGLILAGFALVTTFVVSLTFQGTKAKIAQQQQQELVKVLSQIIPDDNYDSPLYQHCVQVSSEQFLGTASTQRAFIASKNNEPVAMAIETTAPDGYSGDIHLIVGIDKQGKVLGVRTLSHQETPGLGDHIELRKSDWVESFKGRVLSGQKDPRWAVKKDGGSFDQFTGATITPRAYVKAVKNTLIYFQYHFDEIAASQISCEGQ